MAAGAGAGRQLYGYVDATVWDHSPSTYGSAYLAMTTGLVAAALTATQWSGLRGETWGLCMQTIFACLFQGVGFGMAGIAVHIVDTRSERGQFVDTDIWGTNSGWIFPWFFAVVFKPLSSACLLGAAAAYVGTTTARFRAVQLANVVGLLVALYETFLVLSDQIFGTPAPEFYWGLFATGVACGVVPLLGWGTVGMPWIWSGLIVRLIGYLYVVFGPCTSIYSQDGCPFPQDPNKNMLFNVFVAISVIPIYYGAVRKSSLDHEYQELLKKEAAAKNAARDKDGRRCCEGFTYCASPGFGSGSPGCGSRDGCGIGSPGRGIRDGCAWGH